ncbi:MAG: hypothetical protein LBR27_00720 [Bifidobacteriaceae bacterium]|jgi:hypothetical protein|nr:hypothetical protein [Bifidobacteriaceae bacterium]
MATASPVSIPDSLADQAEPAGTAEPVDEFAALRPKRSVGRLLILTLVVVVSLGVAGFARVALDVSVAQEGEGEWTTVSGSMATGDSNWESFGTSTKLRVPSWPGVTVVSVTGSGCFEATDQPEPAVDQTTPRYGWCGLSPQGIWLLSDAEYNQAGSITWMADEDGAYPATEDLNKIDAPLLPRHLSGGGEITLELSWLATETTAELRECGRAIGTEDGGSYWDWDYDACPEPTIDVTLRTVIGTTKVEHLTLAGLPAAR